MRRLNEFIRRSGDLVEDFKLSSPVIVKWQGVGGRTVAKVLKHDLPVVKELAPNIVILQLGTNDLAH